MHLNELERSMPGSRRVACGSKLPKGELGQLPRHSEGSGWIKAGQPFVAMTSATNLQPHRSFPSSVRSLGSLGTSTSRQTCPPRHSTPNRSHLPYLSKSLKLFTPRPPYRHQLGTEHSGFVWAIQQATIRYLWIYCPLPDN